MTFKLIDNSLHSVEVCSYCAGRGESAHCLDCNNGEVSTKVDLGKKPTVLMYNGLPMYTKEYNNMVDEHNQQTALREELIMACKVLNQLDTGSYNHWLSKQRSEVLLSRCSYVDGVLKEKDPK